MTDKAVPPVKHPQTVRCSSCGAEIVFLRTKSGKTNPVDANTVRPEDTIYEHGRHISHFATCSQADRFRKPR